MKRFLLFKRNSHTFHFVRIAACKSFLRPLVFVSRSEFHKDLGVNEFLKVMKTEVLPAKKFDIAFDINH